MELQLESLTRAQLDAGIEAANYYYSTVRGGRRGTGGLQDRQRVPGDGDGAGAE